MTQVEKLLKYQEEDEKLLKIEREAAVSEERKNFSQAKTFLTKAPEKLAALDAKARETCVNLETLQKNFEEISETLSDFDNLDELVEGGADVTFYKKNIQQITEQLKAIRAEAAALSRQVKEADAEYQALKKKTIAVQKQYAEYSEIYKKYKAEKLAEMEAVKTELSKLAKDVDPEIMKKYQIKRSERIFPILCGVSPYGKDSMRCSKCGNEVSISGREKISGGGVTECDNCHRFLYKL